MRPMRPWMRKIGLLAVVFAMIGCGTAQPLSRGVTPEPFALELAMSDRDSGRSARYIVAPDGEFRFAGGARARYREAESLGTLTAGELAGLWRIVHDFDLLDASGELFASADATRYDVEIRAGARRNALRTVDDRVPGVRALSERLDQLRIDYRFGEIFDPIESEIERHEGDVRRR